MRKLKIGVIGTGHMGKNHVRILSEEESHFELIGIFDKDQEQAKKLAEQYATASFITIEELLEKVDAVVVAVPSSLHKEIGLLVAKHGKHALIEKPLATNSMDAKEIVNAFKVANLKLAVGHVERFNPVVTELGKILSNNNPFYIEAHRYSPFSGSGRITDTSVVEDLMIHDVDLVCGFMNKYEITDVRSNGEQIQSNNIDFATCMLDFGVHAHAIINASRVSQNKERSITIHTAESCICADLLDRTLSVSKNTNVVVDINDSNYYTQDGVMQKIFVPSREPLREELLALHASIVDNVPIKVSGEDGLHAVEICEKVITKIKENKRQHERMA